jgi:hypothetical protein
MGDWEVRRGETKGRIVSTRIIVVGVLAVFARAVREAGKQMKSRTHAINVWI